jgi:hypothetical protein
MVRSCIPQHLYKAMRQAVAWAYERFLGQPVASLVLVWAGGAALLVSCTLAVYLGAVLLARLALWAYLP